MVPYVQGRIDQDHGEEGGRAKCTANRQTDARSAISAFGVGNRRFEKRREGHSPRLRHVRSEDSACKGGAQPLHWRTDYDSRAECAQLQGEQKAQGCGGRNVTVFASPGYQRR